MTKPIKRLEADDTCVPLIQLRCMYGLYLWTANFHQYMEQTPFIRW